MNLDDVLKNDSETSKWLAEIESFRSPPPPRKLFDEKSTYSSNNLIYDSDKNGSMSTKSIAEIRLQSKPQINTNSQSCAHSKNQNVARSNPLHIIDKDEIESLTNLVRRVCRPVLETDIRNANNNYASSDDHASLINGRSTNLEIQTKILPTNQSSDNVSTYQPIKCGETQKSSNDLKSKTSYASCQSLPGTRVYDVPSVNQIPLKKDTVAMKLKGPDSFVVGSKALESQQLKFLKFEAEVERNLTKKSNSLMGNHRFAFI